MDSLTVILPAAIQVELSLVNLVKVLDLGGFFFSLVGFIIAVQKNGS